MSDGPSPLPCAFFARPVLEVARDLIGCTFLFDGAGGRLVEVEAYRRDDPASHSYRGRTERNAIMFGPSGRLYVYFTMGLHFCVNVVCQGEGEAAAVLLRALEPTHGIEFMRRRRGLTDLRDLCSGPAKLTQALGITREHDGTPACDVTQAATAAADGAGGSPRACFLTRSQGAAPHVVATTRIGISVATRRPWRFVDADSRFLSRPLPRAALG